MTISNDLGYFKNIINNMGRWDTGAMTTGECLQLKISLFRNPIKNGIIFQQSIISWTNGARISVALQKERDSNYLELDYSRTIQGIIHSIKYRVTIVSLPSNLGKGEIFYFICPFSLKRCKILYLGYDSHYFKSREAYQRRIYYRSQMSSQLDKHNDKYWSLEQKLNNLYKKHPKTFYKGKETSKQKLINRLEKKQQYHDYMRWRILPKALMKSMDLNGFKDASEMF